MAGALPSLADRLRDGTRPTPAELLRVAREVALGLDALHAAGLLHGRVEPAQVELLADGQARLAGPEGTTRLGDGGRGARDDLRDLGRLLERTLPPPAEGAAGAGEDALAAEGRAVAAWLIDPGPGGAARATEVARALAQVMRGGEFRPPTSGSPPTSSVTPLTPHRVALRLACQGAGVGAVAALVGALGGQLAGVVGAGVGWGVGGVVLTLAEELARGRPARRWPAALAFGALAPGLAILSGAVAWFAVAHSRLPVEVLEGLVTGASGRLDVGAVIGPTLLFFFPGVAFARSRLRGGGAALPAVSAGAAAACVVACFAAVMVIGARHAEAGVVIGMPLVSGLATTVIALLAGAGMRAGRALEDGVLRAAARARGD